MKSNYYIKRISALFLSLLSGAAGAQTNSVPEKNSLRDTVALSDVVITAQYQPNTIQKSTYKIKVIDEEKIQALAAVNLKDALSNELNIRFSQDPILGSGMSLQGLSGQNVKILIDGIAVIGRQNGNLDLSQINLNAIERIEIVEGPLSVNYGTNALAGVINIISKKPKTNSLAVGANLYYETNNTYNCGLHFRAGKKRHGISVQFNRNYFNGWNLTDEFYFLPKKTAADTNRFKSWKPKEQYFGDAHYTYESSTFKCNYRLAYFDELIVNRGHPLKPYYEKSFDDYYKTQRLDNTFHTTLKLKKFKSFNSSIAYNYYKRSKSTYFKDLTDLSEQLSSDASLQDTAVFKQLTARGSFVKSKPYETWDDSVPVRNFFNYDLGYDLNYSQAAGKRIQNNKQGIGDYALFASCEIQATQNLVLRPGLRITHNTEYRSPLIPSFNIKYGTKKWTFRSSYARGFRAPDLKELYFEFVDINHNITGNSTLKAEQSDNYNVNIAYSAKKNRSVSSVEFSGFYNDIHNLITLALVKGTEYSYINIGRFKSQGVSVNASYKIKELSFSAGGSLIGRYNELSSDFPEVVDFSYSPEVRGSINYKIVKWKTSVNCFYKYTGKLPGFMLDENGNPSPTEVGDFHMLDFNLSKHLLKDKLQLSLGLKNMLNVINVNASMSGGAHSESSSSTPVSMGRTYFIKLNYAFQN